VRNRIVVIRMARMLAVVGLVKSWKKMVICGIA
jgi:hypothetical protein